MLIKLVAHENPKFVYCSLDFGCGCCNWIVWLKLMNGVVS
jgi:hypothetical protein